jgi:S1-C subfamily serine protease
MKRTMVEILAGLGVLGVMGILHHQITQLESKTEGVDELRGLVAQSVARSEPDEELATMRSELVQLVDRRLGELERRIEAAAQDVDEAAYLKRELEQARAEAAAIKVEIEQDVTRTRELVQTYRDELRSRDDDVLRTARTNRDELQRIAGRVMPDTAALTRDMLLPTVQLNGQETVGSGTLVRSDRDPKSGKARNYVLTAFHVVRNILADSPRARTEGIPVAVYTAGGRVEAKGFMIASNRELDAAVVELRTEQVFDQVARVLPRDRIDLVEVWDEIYAVGCPLGNDPIPTKGAVSSTRNVLNGTNYWMISAPTYYGNSGGGIFLAEQRCLIGVFSKIYTHGRGNPVVVPHMGLCTPISAIYEWLDGEGLTEVIPQVPLPTPVLVPLGAELDLAAPGR